MVLALAVLNSHVGFEIIPPKCGVGGVERQAADSGDKIKFKRCRDSLYELVNRFLATRQQLIVISVTKR